MPLVFPDIVRFTVVGAYGEQECLNILDAEVQSEGSLVDREEAIFAVAGDIINNWVDHILPVVHANYQINEVRWVDLNTATGSTGSRTETDAETLPQFGSLSGSGMPGNVYVKVVKTLQGKDRTQRNGILRLGGVAESTTVDSDVNSILDTHAAAVNSAFENFKDGINGAALGTETNLGVLHTVEGVATDFSRLSTFSARTGLGTIRRRMPGYGN